MSEGLFSALDLGPDAGDGAAGYRLHRLEVLNWGTFDQQVWRLSTAGRTSLLTGDIGSGKSTLVDALTTLLLPAHKVAYNKAAGAESRERTLRSYVEGHYKSERVEATGRSRSIGLRAGGRTFSVVLGLFVNEGHDETVTIAQVFQQRDRSTPYRFFVTADSELSVREDFGGFGSDLNDLRRRLRARGAQVFDGYPDYSRSLRRLLGIRSEQALELFHQTVSMKSVRNLNEFVRDHMLEPADAAERVREIIGHFEDLTRAHDAVKRAREQLETLTPIVEAARGYDRALADRATGERHREAVSVFVAEQRAAQLDAEIAELESESGRLGASKDEAQTLYEKLAAERESLIEERARAGGDRIGELERLVRETRAQAGERRRRRTLFDDAVSEASMAPVTDPDGFASMSGQVAASGPALESERRALDAAMADQIGSTKSLRAQAETVEAELSSLTDRSSNLPASHAQLRAELSEALGLAADQLPYAGELLDVAEHRAEWRGAAERVLRGFALSLLVPAEHYDAVSRWVNSRRLTFRGREGRQVGAKLVYERVAARRIPLQRQGGTALTLADCLEAKDGPFHDYLLGELTKRADHRCAETLEEFRQASKAVTREGQVRNRDRHEKDDRSRVDDPRTWVLGWANERKVAALQDELTELEEARTAAERELAEVEERRNDLRRRQDALSRLAGFTSWSDLDTAEAEDRAGQLEAERQRLQQGSSRLSEITAALERNADGAAQVRSTIDELTGRIATLTADIGRARSTRSQDETLVASCGPDELARTRASYAALTERLGSEVPSRAVDWAGAGDRLAAELHRLIERLTRELGGLGQSLAHHMGEVLRRWPELGSEMDPSPEARGDFVALHQRVATDDLPRFEQEFKRQLNTNTIRELAQFNNWLRRQAEEIDERIDRINEALGAIPYNPGRYIRLEKERTDNQDVAGFRADLRHATDDALAADGDQYSEQRFLDVKRIIERFRGREGYAEPDRAWTRRVTDVRNWFVFSASEREVETDVEWEHYSDSDGKSGGQKEKLAYTILAASLAYQFGLEWGVTKSKDFRFAVIDEAFGRGSDVSTRYALELFAKLGLQLLIVTPLQKVHVIEPYVSAIGFVDNPSGTASRLQTMTIEEYRERRAGYAP